MKSENIFKKEVEAEEKEPKKRKLKKKKDLQEPAVSKIARERARIAAERNSRNVKGK